MKLKGCENVQTSVLQKINSLLLQQTPASLNSHIWIWISEFVFTNSTFIVAPIFTGIGVAQRVTITWQRSPGPFRAVRLNEAMCPDWWRWCRRFCIIIVIVAALSPSSSSHYYSARWYYIIVCKWMGIRAKRHLVAITVCYLCPCSIMYLRRNAVCLCGCCRRFLQSSLRKW